jgi:hypothetical protein
MNALLVTWPCSQSGHNDHEPRARPVLPTPYKIFFPSLQTHPTQAALNEAVHEWRIPLVDGVCYDAVPLAGPSPLANARSAIR